jgi:hypothetical protein
MSRTRYGPIAVALGAIVLLALATTGTASAWLFDPVTPVAREVRDLWFKAVGVTAFFFILAEALLGVAQRPLTLAASRDVVQERVEDVVAGLLRSQRRDRDLDRELPTVTAHRLHLAARPDHPPLAGL